MASSMDKLVGRLRLDLTQLRSDVTDANKLLQSVGAGINLNMSDVIQKQVKSQLEALETAIRKTASAATTSSKTAETAVGNVSTKIATLVSETQKLKGTDVTVVKKGYTELGEAITETWKNGQLLNTTIKEVGVNAQAVQEAAVQAKELKVAQKEAADQAKMLTTSEQEAANQQKQNAALLKEVEAAYKQLTTARKNYQAALLNGNAENAAYWQNEMSNAQAVIVAIGQQTSENEANAEVHNRIVRLLQQEQTEIDTARRKQQQQTDALKEQEQRMNAIVSRIVSMAATMVVLRGIRSLWSSATDYAQTYYDKLNEIRIVTLMSQDEVNALGASYREMAQEMSVSSTEIVSAATEFYRQGLDDDTVNERLVATTKYAKISSLEFEEAAEIITAATNAMGISADRAIDVFAYLGDASASGADEVGIAMQKAAAAANEFGLTFEWLGAYIATISEQTRQAPEVIGTSMNSIMSRLHSIKSTGYNSEDETQINDIAKALKTIDVALLDNDNNWRAMSDIFNDIAVKWDTLSDKQRSYISTTMAGTRQQNYFLALMNDLAKGAEGGSRAFELYEGAIDSAGVATEKYLVYQESVTAAHDKMTAALEGLYSILSGEVLKAFYNLVTLFAQGTQTLGGTNLIIAAVAAAFVGLGVAMSNAATTAAASAVATVAAEGTVTAATGVMGAAATGAAFSFKTLWTVMSAHPIALAITAFAALAAVIGTVTGVIAESSENANLSMEDIQNNLTSIKTKQKEWTDSKDEIESLRAKYVELSTNTNRTEQDNEELEATMQRIKELCPNIAGAIGDVTSAYAYQSEVVDGLNQKLKEYSVYQQAEARKSARENFSSLAANAATALDEQAVAETRAQIVSDIISWAAENGYSFVAASGKWSKDGKLYSDKDVGNAFGKYINNQYGVSGYNLGKYSPYADYNGGVDSAFYQEGIKSAGTYFEKYRSTAADNAVVAQGTVNDIKDTIEETLRVFADTSELDGIYADWANAQIDNIISAFNYTDTSKIESQLKTRSERITEVIAKALAEQEEAANDPVRTAVKQSIQDAYDKWVEEGTREALDRYNQQIEAWNAGYGKADGVLLKTIDPATISSFKEAAEAATETAEAVEELSTAERYLQEAAQRNARDEAAAQGYAEQLQKAKDALGENGDDLQGFVGYMKELQESNNYLYEGLVNEYDILGKIYTGAVTGTSAVAGLDAALTKAITVADANRKEQGAVSGSVTDVSGVTSVDALYEAIGNALTGGGEENGLASLTAQLDAMTEEQLESLMELYPWLEEVTDGTMSYTEALTAYNEEIAGSIENLQAFLEGISESDTSDNLEVTKELLAALLANGADGLENFIAAWNSLDEATQAAVKDTLGDVGDLVDAIVDGGEESEDTLKDVAKTLAKIEIDDLEDSKSILEGTADAFEAAGQNSAEFASAYGKVTKQVDDLQDAIAAYNFILAQTDKTTDDYATAMSTLSSYTGIAANMLETNLAPAEAMLTEQTAMTANTIAYLANYLYAVAGAYFDPSSFVNGLVVLGSGASSAAQDVAALVNTMLQAEGMRIALQENADGSGQIVVTGGSARTFTPSSSSSSGGGGGGGGGSSSSSSGMTEVERMLDIMEQIQNIQEHYRSMNQAGQSYHSQLGEIQGVIAYLEAERDTVQKNTTTLEENIARIETYIDKKKAELSSLKITDEKYEEVASDLEKLQDAHQEYSLQLINNKTDLDALTKSIKEQQDTIRSMEIELRNTILQAIQDREDLNDRILQGTIDVEDEILEKIKERYEKERDLAIDTAEAKKDALEAEKDLLDEQLKKRKELAEEEDRAKELAELEAQLARISADPTRAKEALSLREQIADLRDEIAWDTAEKEVEAQQAAIDDQIDSLDDYIEYVENYYEELFNNPVKLIEEMKQIISLSDEEIIAWLQKNSEDFATSTEATQQSMTNSWKDMLLDMHGEIETYWEEVESIIAAGDDAVIAFLKENSADYKEAGKLQAEAYVDEWLEQLESLRLAYKSVTADITNYDYAVIDPADTSSDSSSGGGGGGGGTNKDTTTKTTLSTVINNVKNVITNAQSTITTALSKFKNNLSGSTTNTKTGSSSGSSSSSLLSKLGLTQYATGGIASTTGPAWLDGSASAPERVLSPYQTELFETMVESLTRISRVKVGAMPSYSTTDLSSQASAVSVGDIIVNVEHLDNENDYEELGENVLNAVLEKINRTSVVGGIRLNK